VIQVAYISLHADVVGGGEHSLMELIGNLPDSIHRELILPAEGALLHQAEAMDVKVHLLPMPRLGIGSLPALWRWRCFLKAEAFDVLHTNQSRAAFFSGCAAVGLKTKVIFHCRIAEGDGVMDRILMRLSDAIICNSRAVAERFKSYSGKLQVIYNGVSRAKCDVIDKINLPAGAKLLLFVGRLSAEKQPQLALQVFEQLAAEDETLHFAMLGGDDPTAPEFSKSLRDRVSASRFASRIQMPGVVDNVTAWYRHASLLLLTSQHEGFGRVLVEAMAEGVVPVAFAVGGVPEVFEDGVQGYLVDGNNIEMMSHRASELLRDENLYGQMAERGKLRAAAFSVDAHVHAVTEFYEEVLRGR